MQQAAKWSYYNHALVPTTAPHEAVNETPLRDKSFWKSINATGYPLIARWTTDFDCQEETNWWYIIKDKPFDIMDVKKNYRRKIRKGLKNFDIKVIDPTLYARALYQVEVEALASYSDKKSQTPDFDQFVADLSNRRNGVTIAAFSKDDGQIAGYCYDIIGNGYIVGSVQKAKPSQEVKHLNAALIYSELDYFREELDKGYYITAGERNVLHATHFQDYLEKYFGFRKAYSRLQLQYRPGFRIIISCLYPFRRLIKHLEGSKLLCQVSSVLQMEEITRLEKRNAKAE